MKYLILILLLALSQSCNVTRKHKTTDIKKSDSSVVVATEYAAVKKSETNTVNIADSLRLITELTKSGNVVTIEYADDSDSVATPDTSTVTATVGDDVIKTNRKPKKITYYQNKETANTDLKKSSALQAVNQSAGDSSGSKGKKDTHVVNNENKTESDKSTSRASIFIILGLAVVAGIFFFIWFKTKKK